ncbi:hypothetical protein ETB97_007843 [Aspergillus alliaceus]|uniref:DNA 3'-5' helicase n=1 Tax=Petromyces alliaceus TaxID=209559 RepID=A0A8H5ZYE7_PETAA|nr:hypothetical protein ETB97_007843 [Aspergillus burnettii]
MLQCEVYYSQHVDKPSILHRFTQAETTVIATTSALGMGVDTTDIRSIIHIRVPRTLLDYAQESGRAGRDGHRSKAIITQLAGMTTRAPPPEPEGTAHDELVQEYHTSRPQPLSHQDTRSSDGMAPAGIGEWQRQHMQVQQQAPPRDPATRARLPATVSEEFIEGEAGQ